MMTPATKEYAKALHAVATAEGSSDKVRSELLAVSQLIDTNAELRSSVSDRLVPASTRFQVVSDALGGQVSDVTQSLVAMIAGVGQGKNFGEIVSAFLSADATGVQLATVRSAVALTEDQKTRLARNLSASLGGEVEIQNVVDPDVVGGVVTTVGDRVIDGTVRNKLEQMKDSI